ncbi:ATP synthase F1 subunit gamma [Candidatus Peregrinibacteria bacterium]|nr:ATP synthase F1 subunit gamma [Candidatus Peregrinibacteria bacterium]
MAKGTREIRRKIKSITSTRQITKAMELVAASKMRRAVANTVAMRPYARLSAALLTNLSDKTSETLHPLLAKREVKRTSVILISTDRGLCGGLNAQLFRKLSEYIKAEKSKAQPPEISFVAVGKKAQDFLRRTGQKVVAAHGAMSNHSSLKDTYAISRMILNDYTSGAYDKVMLIYTDFISAINQKPTVRRLLPLSRYALEEMVEGLETKTHHADIQSETAAATEYIFEPSPSRVLEMLLPRLTEMQIYQAVLEAAASEHSARMFTMRNASDNADEFITDLTLAYNQIRQAAITAELAEISAGRAALG